MEANAGSNGPTFGKRRQESRNVRDDIVRLIRESLGVSRKEYGREVRKAKKLSGMEFSYHRPIFLLGDPSDVQPHEYILFVGLNPKWDAKDGHEDIDESEASYVRSTLGYFTNSDCLHRYFVRRAKVVQGFLGLDLGKLQFRPSLKQHALFTELVPYRSKKTPSGRLAKLEELPNVQRCRKVLYKLVEEHPPAAIVLDGAATHNLKLGVSNQKPMRLRSRTNGTPCKLLFSRHDGALVVRCNFMGWPQAPNSDKELVKLGKLIARHV